MPVIRANLLPLRHQDIRHVCVAVEQILNAGRIMRVLLVLVALASPALSCEDGHWIESVVDDGRLIQLEDGSLWQVESYDRVTALLWLPETHVIVCDGRIVSEYTNEAVDARRIR
jgi:hypothetical protein